VLLPMIDSQRGGPGDGIHYLEGVVWLVMVSLLVDRMRRLFLTSTARRVLDGVCGTRFVGFGVRLAVGRS
jgi:threonine/homoserine/homoserine lactone efflux protein